MKKVLTCGVIFLLMVFDGLAETQNKPNIIFILLDDLGKEWIGCYGAQDIQTPNIDELAAGGMKFNNAYSMPQCTPSRVCFMTGQYPFRNGWVNHWDVPRWGIGYYDWGKNPSIARVMQAAGYRTAVAGKWQLNDFREHPDAMVQHGFDEYCMWTGGETDSENLEHKEISDKRYWDPYIHTKTGSKTYNGEFGPDIYNQFLLDFIADNKAHPFFIYYPMTLPHTPFVTTPHEPTVEGELNRHKAMVRYIDYLIGKTINHLEQLGIRERTIVVFTTDNGSVGRLTNVCNGRKIRGGKTKTTENGVNAPFIVNCPGLVPAGKSSNALIDFSDMLPTFADFAGSKLEPSYDYDGSSLKEVFLGKSENSSRKWILAMGSHPGVATDAGIENEHYFRDRVIRGARYKLFVDANRTPEKLVDLERDPAEENNLLNRADVENVQQRLEAVIGELPYKDGDPIYRKIPGYPEFRADSNGLRQSQIHKIGYPASLQ
jgi:arylsulfatase A-like enzyme